MPRADPRLSATPLSCGANAKSGTIPAPRIPAPSSSCFPNPVSPFGGGSGSPRHQALNKRGHWRPQERSSAAALLLSRETKQHRNWTTATKIASVNGWGPCYDGPDEVLVPSWRKHLWLLQCLPLQVAPSPQEMEVLVMSHAPCAPVDAGG